MPAKQRLDLTRVAIRPFVKETVVNRFSCGKMPIDRFLKNKAKKSNGRYEHRIFCAHIDLSHTCVGYYALQLGTDSVSEFAGSKDTYLSSYTAFPAVHLSYLGVHEEYRRQGLGQHLLMDAFEKVAEISKYAGFYAMTLQSLDDDATAFYKSLGFSIYSENLKQPKMLYPLADILTLTGG